MRGLHPLRWDIRPPRRRPLHPFGLVAGAGQDGKTRVFRKIRIGLRELAEEKLRTFVGFYNAGMEAVGT